MGELMLFNKGWKFHLGEALDAQYIGIDDRGWRNVTLPHDWAVEHPFDKVHSSGTGYLPGGIGWYRKHFVLPEDIKDKRVRITFDGVYNHSRVWVNTHYIGYRSYGYSTFTYDISEFVHPGENVISVRVAHEHVADSRWFTGSGIYRNVHLEITDKCCFEKDGIFIDTKNVDSCGTAEIEITYKTIDCNGAEFFAEDETGKAVASCKSEGAESKVTLKVENAKLWSPDTPNMYTLRCHSLKDEKITDEVTIPFGIRTFIFDADKGFFLNGVNMKIKGVCVHHDAGVLGAAVPTSVWERRLKKFKEAGCNALRTSHNPPSPDLLDLCDTMGLLVMDEAFDEWEGFKNKWWHGHNVDPAKHYGYADDFPQWHKIDLEAMILRDRNHPSIVMWSIGNEIDFTNDPYASELFLTVSPEENNDYAKSEDRGIYDNMRPDMSRLATVAKELVDIVHNIDVSRPVLSAFAFPEFSTRTGFADALDMLGYNYKEHHYTADHKRFPDKAIIGSENSHNPKAWYAVRDNDYISGQFLWTGIDFLGECHGWPIRISTAGLLDLCGNAKAHYYRRKALWTQEPFVKIAVSKGEKEKTNCRTDNFVYYANKGEKMQVSCYTNTGKAELFLNGKSLSEKTISDEDGCRVTWEIPFEEGVLTAKVDGAEDTLCSPCKAEKICFNPDKTQLSADGMDVVQIEVSLLDKNGNLACADDRVIYYQLLGDAEILGIENGKRDDITGYNERFRQTHEGKAILYLRAGEMADEITLYAYTHDGLKEKLILTSK